MKKVFCPYKDCRKELSGDIQTDVILVSMSIGDHCIGQSKGPEFINCPHCKRPVEVAELIVCD